MVIELHRTIFFNNHLMAEGMEGRLRDYHDFVESFKDDAVSLLSS
jgi:hypothetical protein